MIELPLYNRFGIAGFSLIDDDDEDLLLPYRWNLNHNGYASTDIAHPEGGRYVSGRKRRTSLLMHRLVMRLERGDLREPDHIDRNRINNQKANLRVGTRADNMQNVTARQGASSLYRGVYWSEQKGKWCAQVRLDRHSNFLGAYNTPEEAAEVASRWRADNMPYSEDARMERR